MGCFSSLCKVCGKGVQSTSFSGHECHLFLLKEGKVIEYMSGEYNSYGGVFIDDHSLKARNTLSKLDIGERPNSLRDSQEWKMDWSDCCELMFDKDPSNGFAYYHDWCYNGQIPTTQSDGDPNQGWGEGGEDFADASMKYTDE